MTLGAAGGREQGLGPARATAGASREGWGCPLGCTPWGEQDGRQGGRTGWASTAGAALRTVQRAGKSRTGNFVPEDHCALSSQGRTRPWPPGTSPATAQAPCALFFLLPPALPCPSHPPASLGFSLSPSLSLSSTRKALLYFLVTLIDCINLSAYWISPAPCREHCAICL